MAAPAPAEGGLGRRLGYAAIAAAAAVLSLLLLETLLDRRFEQARLRQLGSEVSGRLLLGEVALERFSPAALAELGGLRLAVGDRPEPVAGAAPRWPEDRRLRRQAEGLRGEICRRLPRCPLVWPARAPGRGVWVEMASPLESVWLFVPLPPLHPWPPDPLLLGVGLASGSLAAGLLYLHLEVRRPLGQLEAALAQLGLEERPAAVAARGNPAVRALTARFNAMVVRLEATSRERAAMLAGIAHDLRSPLTRLRLRLALAERAPMGAAELALAEADLTALERITRQFLVFAGAEAAEPALVVPLEQLLAEVAAGLEVGADAGVVERPLALDLPPLERCVRPAALARAIANLLDNAVVHGRPPLRLALRPWGESGFEIQVWDGGEGLPERDWERARQPFQRLDPARGGQGHCGLGLAIAEAVARDHGGGLLRLESAPGFGVGLRGRSLPVGPVTSGHRLAAAGWNSGGSELQSEAR
jgi:two-component system osmolarity sensor histidine kinase EnvZ